MKFELKPFEKLSPKELHSILMLRAKVFVVEQNCAYQDPDDRDLISEHLLLSIDGDFCGCARLFDEEQVTKIGRVVVDPGFRGKGFGKALMRESIRVLRKRALKGEIVIHAQYRLSRFYQDLGFQPFGEIFLEDGIDHVKMKLTGF